MFESVAEKLDGRKGVKRPLRKNKFEELRAHVSQEKLDIIFITETQVKTSVQNNKFNQRDSLNEHYLEGYILFQYE